mmetsp:Transcript_10176/g.18574  ORF Transcript_10176/g.18574 Transcript_10176/m.18574 type:complete len:217 (-) Transcript_10176:228-878(-)
MEEDHGCERKWQHGRVGQNVILLVFLARIHFWKNSLFTVCVSAEKRWESVRSSILLPEVLVLACTRFIYIPEQRSKSRVAFRRGRISKSGVCVRTSIVPREVGPFIGGDFVDNESDRIWIRDLDVYTMIRTTAFHDNIFVIENRARVLAQTKGWTSYIAFLRKDGHNYHHRLLSVRVSPWSQIERTVHRWNQSMLYEIGMNATWTIWQCAEDYGRK